MPLFDRCMSIAVFCCVFVLLAVVVLVCFPVYVCFCGNGVAQPVVAVWLHRLSTVGGHFSPPRNKYTNVPTSRGLGSPGGILLSILQCVCRCYS